MLERKDAIKNEVLEPVTFVLAYPTVLVSLKWFSWKISRHLFTGKSYLGSHENRTDDLVTESMSRRGGRTDGRVLHIRLTFFNS